MGEFVIVGTAGQTNSPRAMPVVLVDKDNSNFYNASIVGGSGGTAMVDDAAFAVGTEAFTLAGGTYRAVRDSVNDGDGGAFAMTATRAIISTIETPSGDSAMDDTNDAVKVNVVAGGAGDGSILDGVSAAIKATVLDYTNSNPLAVRLTDTTGDYIAAGAGTQYADGAARGTATGSLMMVDDGTLIQSVAGTAAGLLKIDLSATGANSNAIVVGQATGTNLHAVIDSGSITADTELTTADLDTGAGTDTRAVVGLVGAASGGGQLIPGTSANGLLVNLGANNAVTVTSGSITVVQGTGTNLHAVVDSGTVTTVSTVTNLSQLGGQAIAMGTGARSAGTQRVTIATDDVVPASQSGTWNIGTVTTCSTVTNLSQLGGQAIAMGTGARSAGTLRVTVATDDVVPVTQTTAANLKVQSILMDAAGTNLANVHADGGLQTGPLPTGKSDYTTTVTGTITATGSVTIWAAAGSKALKEIYVGANGLGAAAKCTFKRNTVAIGDIYLTSVNFMSKDKLDFATTDLTVDVVTDNASALPVYFTVKYYS